MTRQEYIDAVKVKIEEISPFDEPDAFIAADGDADYANVKPIVAYIDKSLDEATRNCLRALPLSLLHADVVSESKDIVVTADGVGSFAIPANIRPIRFHSEELLRDITAFITSEDPLYLLQQNKYTRGGIAKPMAVISSGEVYNVGGFPTDAMGQMEIYTLRATGSRRTIPATEVRSGVTTPTNRLLYIPTDKHLEDLSHIEYISISSNNKKYFPFAGAEGDEYDGTTYGKRVSSYWYRGWRAEDGDEVYTSGDATPSMNATAYIYSGGSMNSNSITVTKHTPAFTDTRYVKSPIEELIVLECAAMVSDILGNPNAAAACRNEQQTKIQAILK